jgi:K+-sensing histidine kinase KdpD
MENLVALRELSLRFVADETEEELLEYLRSHGRQCRRAMGDDRTDHGGRDRRTRERTVIRRAARIAARVKADLLAST